MNELKKLCLSELKKELKKVDFISVSVRQSDDMCVRVSRAALLETLRTHNRETRYDVVIINGDNWKELLFLGFNFDD